MNDANHVDNVVIYGWFDQQRMQLCYDLGFDMAAGFFPAVRNAGLEYHRELFDHSPIRIDTFITKVGNSSFVVKQTMKQDDEVCASCETLFINIVLGEKVSMPVPDDMKEKMKRNLIES